MMSYKPIETFGFFYDKYGAMLFGYILSITKNEKQSEVILIKAFLEIFQRYKEYDSTKQSLLVWSIGFANRQIIEINKTERKLIINFKKFYKQNATYQTNCDEKICH